MRSNEQTYNCFMIWNNTVFLPSEDPSPRLSTFNSIDIFLWLAGTQIPWVGSLWYMKPEYLKRSSLYPIEISEVLFEESLNFTVTSFKGQCCGRLPFAIGHYMALSIPVEEMNLHWFSMNHNQVYFPFVFMIIYKYCCKCWNIHNLLLPFWI